eukprot:PhM_4_TR10417/c0_g1_i1/m.73106
MEARLKNVVDSVSGLPVRDHNGSRVASFVHTDFVSPISHTLVEDMAMCIIASGVPVYEADVIVSVADRIAGSLTHALARLTDKPYTLANWYPEGSPGDVEVEPSGGFSGTGVVFLNGLKPGMKVLFVDDGVVSGVTSANLIEACRKAGATVLHAAFVIEVVEAQGRENKMLQSIPITSLVRLTLEGATTRVVATAPISKSITIKGTEFVPSAAELRMAPKSAVAKWEKVTEAGFIGLPILVNKLLGYPYSFFQFSDFKPIMPPSVIEIMADLCCHYCDFSQCDVIVSEADRGGGPLAHAVAQRTGLPYILVVWSTTVEQKTSVRAQIGYSGNGSLFVNGLQKGMRVGFVDDMISSGGTAEGIFRLIEAYGATPVESVFISEKLYPGTTPRKGLARLRKNWPDLPVTCLVQFVAQGTHTKAPPHRNPSKL